jgi:hypothetical protein
MTSKFYLNAIDVLRLLLDECVSRLLSPGFRLRAKDVPIEKSLTLLILSEVDGWTCPGDVECLLGS